MGSERRFPSPGFWLDDHDGLLFLFHLHSFQGLAVYASGPREAEADAFWERVAQDWLEVSGEPSEPAWHPFPTSGRIIAWCAALSAGWGEGSADPLRESAARQLRFLSRRVEHDIGGNHVLRNAVALVIGGACLDDARARRRGLKTLERELPRQILGDGGHEERSPSYHRVVLDDLRDAHRVAGGEPLARTIGRMERWLAALTGPDGALPLLNDAWEGPPVEPLEEPVTDLADTGYVVLRAGRDQAVCDIAPLAPRHLPPHAHADALSFVLWGDGQPLVVDPGAYRYTGPDRDRFRATAAHSTLEVAGEDQCDFWGSFRATSLPNLKRVRHETVDGVVVIAGEHDGYRRLATPAIHRRTFCWVPGGGIVVVDRLESAGVLETTSRLPLAPGVDVTDGCIGPFRMAPLGAGDAPRVVAGRYGRYLGTAEATKVVERDARLSGGDLTGWALLRDGYAAELDAGRLTITTGEGRRLEIALRT